MGEQVFGSGKQSNNGRDEDILIPDSARTQKEISTFYLWFASNLTVADFALGFIPVALGLSVMDAIFSLIVGNVLGGILLAFMSAMGPKTGLPQMAMGMRPMGRIPGRIISLLQWSNTGGWLTVNIVIASLALSTAFSGMNYVVSIALSVIVVAVAAFLGGKAIHGFEKIMSFVLGIMFAFLTAYSLLNTSAISSYSASPVIPAFAGMGITIAVSFSYLMSWSPYASDYSRYVRPGSSTKKVVLYTFLGGAIASFWLEVAGILVAIASGDAAGNPAGDLFSILGGFGFLGMIALFLGGLSANSLNLYSNSVSLKAAGVKMKRTYLVILVSVVVFAISIIGYGRFYHFYESFLLILDYWITPWIGIVLADFFIVQKGSKMSLSEAGRASWVGVASYVVAVLVSIPFMAPSASLTGPLAATIGGVDVSYFISFLVAVALYVFLYRHAKSK